MRSGHNMCDEKGKENLQVGNIHLQYHTPQNSQRQAQQDNRDHLGCHAVFVLLCELGNLP